MTQLEKLNITQQSFSNAPVGAVGRLGYPGLFYADGAEGVRGAPPSSAYAVALNAARSFDRDLMYRRAKAIGCEARAKGVTTQFGPGLNMARTAQGGRAFEYNGPDPYLAGVAGMYHVYGLQDQGVMATARHYIGNDQETGRQWTSSDMDDRTAHEVYLWPFQDAVHAGVTTIMCSYNGLNGTYSCANPTSMGKWLHEELNFQGWVLTDFGALYGGYQIESALSGTDTVLGFTTLPYGQTGPRSSATPFGNGSVLEQAVDNGTVPQARLNDMVTRIVSAWYKLGQDNGYPTLDTSRNALSLEVDDQIRQDGAKTIILLKNEGDVLPFGNETALAIFGQSATVALTGFPPRGSFGGTGPADAGTFFGGSGSSYVYPPYLITPYEALNWKTRQTKGQISAYFDNLNHTLQASWAQTAMADACIVDVRTQCGEGQDRMNLTASYEGDQTIVAVANACNNTVVLYSSCGPFAAASWFDHPNVTAILDCGGLGQDAGNSIVDVLFGDVNPSAKLPYTIAYNVRDEPTPLHKRC